MDCQDCGKHIATDIVFNMETLEFFAVCEKCIKDDDRIVPSGLIKEVSK